MVHLGILYDDFLAPKPFTKWRHHAHGLGKDLNWWPGSNSVRYAH